MTSTPPNNKEVVSEVIYGTVTLMAVAETLENGGCVSRNELRGIWRGSRPVTVYSQLPTLAFALSGLGVFSIGAAFWIAELVGLVILFIAGYLVGRRVGSSPLASAVSGFAVGAVGGVIMLLKLLSH